VCGQCGERGSRKCETDRMRLSRTEFVGGPLDGRQLPVAVNLAERVPAEYLVEVPARGGDPARVAVYRSEPVHGPDGRRRWRYVFVSG
jgi:hypothetical protein